MDLIAGSKVKESRLPTRDPLPSSQSLGSLVVAGGSEKRPKTVKNHKRSDCKCAVTIAC